MNAIDRRRVAASAGVLALAVVYLIGALGVRGEVGYGGVGPNFLPWVVGLVLLVCGCTLLWQAARGDWTQGDTAEGAVVPPNWLAFAWVSAGLMLNAALILYAGFVLSCALCFALASRGFRSASGNAALSARDFAADYFIGLAIAAPVYWLFGLGLNVSLPGLTQTGFI